MFSVSQCKSLDSWFQPVTRLWANSIHCFHKSCITRCFNLMSRFLPPRQESDDLCHAMSSFSLFLSSFSGAQRILGYVRPRRIEGMHLPKRWKRRGIWRILRIADPELRHSNNYCVSVNRASCRQHCPSSCCRAVFQNTLSLQETAKTELATYMLEIASSSNKLAGLTFSFCRDLPILLPGLPYLHTKQVVPDSIVQGHHHCILAVMTVTILHYSGTDLN